MKRNNHHNHPDPSYHSHGGTLATRRRPGLWHEAAEQPEATLHHELRHLDQWFSGNFLRQRAGYAMTVIMSDAPGPGGTVTVTVQWARFGPSRNGLREWAVKVQLLHSERLLATWINNHNACLPDDSREAVRAPRCLRLFLIRVAAELLSRNNRGGIWDDFHLSITLSSLGCSSSKFGWLAGPSAGFMPTDNEYSQKSLWFTLIF